MSELQCIKFGEMAQQITTKVNPKDTSLNTYVGLEHLDTGSLQINRKGTPQDVIGEKLRVCKGDIIFGKRRVYQRKVAIADFDGICSAHAMVLRPKEDVVEKDFFPFFMQSDVFMERALQISVGSLSPTINWKTLSEQKFTIPSLPDQRSIAISLWAAEDCIVKAEGVVAAAERAKQVLMLEYFSGRKIKRTQKWEKVKFSQIVDSYKNGIYKTPEFYGSGLPQIRMFNIVEGKINKKNAPLLDVTDTELKEYQLLEGDILINRVNSIDLVGKAGIVAQDLGDVTYESKNIRIRVKHDRIIPEFLIHYLQTKEYSQQIRRKNKSAIGQATVNQTDLADLDLPLPPLSEQRQIAAILTRCDETIAAARANTVAAKALKMKMINEMLMA